MKCWHCGAETSDPFAGKISFRATCDACGAALHCCRNCVFYRPGLPNDCAVPDTDYIADRTASNFCEDFKLLGKGPVSTVDPNEASKRLFGEDSSPPKKDPKKRFDALFGDED